LTPRTDFFKTTLLPLAAAALTALSGCGGGEEPADEPDLSVVLVLVDTFRADHAGCYGYERPTTPVMDSLAEAGTRCASFQSQSSWTLPAMTTLMSGLDVRQHGAGKTGQRFYGVDTAIPYLPHMLQRRGYATGAFFNVVFMDADFGFHRGFDHFDCQGFANRMSLRRADETVDEAIAWIDGLPEGQPFLAAVHFYDPHISYDPPPPYDTLFTDPDYSGEYGPGWGEVSQLMAVNSGADTVPPDGLENLVALYDGELAFADAQLGRLTAYLRRTGLDRRTVVVVTADHGEEFADHGGVEHGHTLYQELLAVPMVLSGPGVPAGAVVEETAAGIDLLPTLAGLLDLQLPPECGGQSLLRPLPENRAVPSSGTLWAGADLACVVRDDGKVIWSADADSAVGYDLGGDPRELSPVPPDSSLVDEVLAYWATPPVARPEPVDYEAAVDRTLRDLGYIR
jgi:arylsulfatase